MTATFQYKALSGTGELVRGTIEAPSRAEALHIINDRGFRPFDVSEAKGAGARLILFSPRPLRPGEKARLVRDLATLLQAEIGVDQSLRVLVTTLSKARVRSFVEKVIELVAAGKPLSDAFAARPGSFGNDEIAMIRAGEQGGMLPKVLDQLAHLLERRLEIRQKITTAMIYPALLVVASLAAVFFILTVLIPTILPLFEGSGLELPVTIFFLLSIGQLLETSWPVFAAGFLLLSFGIRSAWRSQRIRAVLDHTVLRLPLVGPFARRAALASLARTMSMLLQSGVHLQQALAAASEVVGNAAARREIALAREEVIRGKRLSQAMHNSIVLDSAARRLLSVGEESNRLEDMLLHIAGDAETSLVRGLERAMALLTPCLTLILGVSIGWLIMSVMQAIMSVNEIAVQ